LSEPGRPIQPLAFRPPVAAAGGARQRVGARRWLRPALLVGAIGLLLAVTWLALGIRAITLDISPRADRLQLEGGPCVKLGGRFWLWPGTYTVVAHAAGYRPLRQQVKIASTGARDFRFALEKLPGRLALLSDPDGVSVEVDGKRVGTTPLTALALAAGPHALVLRAQRHEVYRHNVLIEGMDRAQRLQVKLVPAWAAITVESRPAGATVRVDGDALGSTPLRAEIGAGSHRLELTLRGYQPWQGPLQVVARQPRTLPVIALEPARASVQIRSEPAGASIAVAGEFAGRTPLTVTLAPDRRTEIRATLAGYQPAQRAVSVPSGAQRMLALSLEPILGEVRVHATPADAELFVDNQPRGLADQTLTLTAVAHQISIRKPGYGSHDITLTPQPGLAQEVAAQLVSKAEAASAKVPAQLTNAAGQRMVLVPAGRFTMGAPRSEPGRRSNEVERQVELTRAFYMGVHEISNAQFRAFRAEYASGIVGKNTLDNDNTPVLRIGWDDAVAYCNWLSQREGLPLAYQNGELVKPVNTGYRLPSEAEWEWAARFAGARKLKYPWGNTMPPTGAAGNYADVAAMPVLTETLAAYNDTYVATAPVASFTANALGLFDLGGNVSEWVHDRYSAALIAGSTLERDPFGPATGAEHVLRGSSWRHSRITELRLSWRDASAVPRDDLGFRVVRHAP